MTLSPTVKLGVPTYLFDDDPTETIGLNIARFDVARDRRFLMLVQNWIGAMKRQ